MKDSTVSFEGRTYGFGTIGSSGVYGFKIFGINENYNLTLTNFKIEDTNLSGNSEIGLELFKNGLFNEPKDVKINDFTIKLENSEGIHIMEGIGIEISDGNIDVGSGNSIVIEDSENITLDGLEINASKIDLNVTDSQVNLVNQNLLNYSFTAANITVINNYGKIKFNELITESGEGFSNEIQISNNYVYVNSAKSNGLNVSAEVTLYDVYIGQGEARILKNGVPCTDCGSLIRNGNDFTFTVTGFSNYTIDASMCGWYVNESSTLNESLNCSGTGLIINSSDIVLDCDGFNITYGNNGHNNAYGVYNLEFDNVTIKNCGIIEGNNSGSNKHGIYNFLGDYINLSNNYIHTISSTSGAIKLFYVNNGIVEGNYLISNASSGYATLHLDQDCANNTLKNNIVVGGHIGIKLEDIVDLGSVSNTTLINNSISNTTIRDFSSEGTIIGVDFIDQIIDSYSIGLDNLRIQNRYGEIYFGLTLDVWGGNLNQEVVIAQTRIVVNSSNSGWNKSAQLTFYNVNLTGDVRSTRNGELCDAYCSNITQQGDNYSYNVTSFTRYGLTTDAFCGETITWNLNQTMNLECDNTAWHIGADNIVIDCQGHNITYGNSSFGYGINNSGYNNVIIKNCNFIEGPGTGNSKHGINIIGSRLMHILNNTITTTNTGYGINLEDGRSNIIENNTITTEDDDCYGIKSKNNGLLNVKGNIISTFGDSFESSAIRLTETNYGSNSYISNNIINTDGQNAYGIHLYDDTNIIVENNDIETSNSNSVNIYLEHVDRSRIINNSAKVTNGAAAIYIYGHSDNNLIENNTVEQARIGIEISGGIGDYPDNNTLKNNDLQIITQRDLVVEEDVTNLWLVNQNIKRYYIVDADVNFKNDYGIIDFIEEIVSTGENLDEDVILTNNLLGTYASGFDKKANLTIYNITILGTAETKRNSERCGSYCDNLTSFNCDGNICDYSFNVTGFSNYSVGELGVNCGDTINNTLFMIYSLPSCTGTGIFIGDNNLVINCQNNNITYGDGNGINNTGFDNVTIRNCNLLETGINEDNDAIYFKDSEDCNLENNSITTINNESDGFYLDSTNSIIISENDVNSSAKAFNMQDAEDTTIENNIIIQNETIDLGEVEDVWFIDQEILGYIVDNAEIKIKETGVGAIEFLEGISGSGNNLSEDIVINENFVYVNVSGINGSNDFNKSAILRLYNLSFNGTINVLRNGADCGSYCSEIFANGEEEYYFNVTGFSNYSFTSEPAVCNQTIYSTLYLNESLFCNGDVVNIGADGVIIDCQGHNITYGNNSNGSGIRLNEHDNVIIRNCEIIEGSVGGHGIYIDGENGEIYNNEINVNNENSSALYFNLSSENSIWNNTLNSSGTESYVIYLLNSSSNNLENNTINDGGVGIKINSGSSNILHNNSIINIDNEEINISNSNYNLLFAQDADDYDLNGIVYFENDYGKIEYNEVLNQKGINLSSDINITNNSIEVTNKIGLNKSANITFYNVTINNFAIPLKNWNGNSGDYQTYWCPGTICSGLSKNGNDYSMSVTEFSNYTIYNYPESGCGLNLVGSIILGQNVGCGFGVNINANNVVLDCNGYTLLYGNDASGINNPGYDDVTIKNCILKEYDNTSLLGSKAILFNNTNNGILENNSYLNLTTNNIYVENSTDFNMKYCGAANYTFIESYLSFENDYGKIDYDSNITTRGDDLSEEVSISNNLIHVDSSSGLNVGADLSFYDLSISGTAYAMRNTASCSNSICSGFSNSENDYFFTVSGFSNYSVGNNISNSGGEEDEGNDPAGSGGSLMGDFRPPVKGSPFPVGKIYLLSPTLSLVTDEVATCRWDFNDRGYGQMDYAFQYLGRIHIWKSTWEWGLGNYTIYAKCMDANRNTDSTSYTWNFEIINESYCGNGVCEDDETFENCPDDCGEEISYFEENDVKKGDGDLSNDLAGRAYSILELLENTELGTWLVYLLVSVVLIGGYFISHRASSWLTGVDNKENPVDKIKPELVLSAKKIKYRLMNEDVYNATLEYLHMKELFNQVPKKYKVERRYLYNYMIEVYNKIQTKVDEINLKNKNN
ncbi:MAG: right-handed parallel beta-helix repeat-containing protein [Nanoarchaeota archaeon]|nr:right-handed parallel beta-helix repeat-containing protein [Nanoarchaeota archaeon]